MNIRRNVTRIVGKYFIIDTDSSETRNYHGVLKNSFHKLGDFLTR